MTEEEKAVRRKQARDKWAKSEAGIAYRLKWEKDNRERISARAKAWQRNNREKYNSRLREWRSRQSPEKKRQIYLQQKEREKAYTGQKRERRLETFRKNSARFRKNSTDEQKQRDRASKAKYKKANRHKDRAYNAKRRATDPQFVIAGRLRNRLRQALWYYRVEKYNSTFSVLGCTIEFFIGYIEAQFKDGMTWDTIHVDHIRPLKSFDLTDPEQQRRAFHYSNLQPLFKADNLKKGARLANELRQAQLL